MNEIKCNVTNCMYHSGTCDCTAKEIHVDTQCKKDPSNCSDTECGTFAPKN